MRAFLGCALRTRKETDQRRGPHVTRSGIWSNQLACTFSFVAVLFFHEQALHQIDYYFRYRIGGIALDLKVHKRPAQKAGFCFLGSYRGLGNNEQE